MAAGDRAIRAARDAARTTFLQATPIDVSELLSELCSRQIPTVVLTSATLTVQGGFEHIRRRLGLTEARELVVPSHFRYGEQALLYLPPEMPDPRDAGFSGCRRRSCIRRVLEHPMGRAFCLFTSYQPDARSLRAAAAGAGLSDSAAGQLRRARRCWRSFARRQMRCCLGTSSFWQGVDVQGEALSCVIIDRLPFAVPTTRWCRRA